MASNHELKSGECINTLAHDYKLPWEKIWNHPNNAELKEKRKEPSVLKAGDLLFIPDKAQKSVSVATNKAHQFVMKSAKTHLRLRTPDETEIQLNLGHLDPIDDVSGN